MRRSSIILGAAGLLLAFACGRNTPDVPDTPSTDPSTDPSEDVPSEVPEGMERVSYTISDEIIANPERGFYSGSSFSKDTDSPLSKNALKVGLNQKRTLYMLEFWFKDFFESDLSDAYLELISKSLAVFRESGVKCILRFGYSDGIKDLSDPYASGPFDPTEEQVLRHIAQLKPILGEYADIIYVLQAGFVGCWGEWYYTNNFISNPATDEDYLPRKHVCDALLDALPGNRQVELRTPKYKMKMYGWALADTLTLAESHTSSAKARLAGHNDCYLADSSDQGTFSTPSEKEYWKAESRYLILGGETCNLSNFCKCDNTLTSLSEYHYSYLNTSYNKSVINYWEKNSCLDEIKMRLGYRFSLISADFTSKPVPGGEFRAVLNIRNDGFASAMNPRDAFFVLTSGDGKVVGSWEAESDPCYWMPGHTTIVDKTFTLPAGLSGEYTLSLNLSDPAGTLKDNPLFSIRLANEGIWDEMTGYNKLYTFTL